MSGNDEKVGYRRPPVHSRFVKGQSGNPKGRGTSRPSLAQDLQAVMDRPIPVTIDGEARKMSATRVLIRKIRNRALRGDIGAMRMMIDLMQGEGAQALEASVQEELDLEAILQDVAKKSNLDVALLRRPAGKPKRRRGRVDR